MKNGFLVAIIALFALFANEANAQDKAKVQNVTFTCDIDCHSCKNKIMQQIPYEKGVKDVQVDIQKKEVTVEFKTAKNNTEDLIKAFKEIGFTAVVKDEGAKKEKAPKEEKQTLRRDH
ncbi:MAG: heavy-metal-associated domain-containing protein [Salinivirgaceae bacterium]